MDIRVTFRPGKNSTLALVRYKEPGQKPVFRAVEVPTPIHEHWDAIIDFALSRAGIPAQVQGWLWEA